MRKILLIGMMFFTMLGVVACNNQSDGTLETIASRGYFVVGLDDTFAPMGFRDTSGNIVGFDVDLAKEVARRLDVEVRFQPIDWDAKVLELNAKNIDLIWNGLTITEPRKLEMTFSNPYIANAQAVLVKADSGMTQLSDLAGKKIGVQISSAADEVVSASSIRASFQEYLKFDTYATALLELRSGFVDAIVIDEIMGRYLIAQSGDNLVFLEEDFGEEEYGIGFRFGDIAFRDRVNEILQEMITDGTVTQISLKWFGEDVFLRMDQ